MINDPYYARMSAVAQCKIKFYRTIVCVPNYTGSHAKYTYVKQDCCAWSTETITFPQQGADNVYDCKCREKVKSRVYTQILLSSNVWVLFLTLSISISPNACIGIISNLCHILILSPINRCPRTIMLRRASCYLENSGMFIHLHTSILATIQNTAKKCRWRVPPIVAGGSTFCFECMLKWVREKAGKWTFCVLRLAIFLLYNWKSYTLAKKM